jgi:RHS repeat-associated protein
LGAAQYYLPDVLSYSDYYPFGMQMPGRNGGEDYRYAFNGMEQDPEVSGDGNSYTTEFRQYDPRLGRWKSLDPLMAKFPNSSPYVAFADNPIVYVDPDGGEPVKKGVIAISTLIWLLGSDGIDDLNSFSDHFELGGSYGRYLYSDKWGWVDMKHFSSAAENTDDLLQTGHAVLLLGEFVESTQYLNGDASGFDPEDLPSNLLGVYFETYLESEAAEGKSLVENLESYLLELGFSDDPTNDAPNYDVLPETHDDPDSGVINMRYEPLNTKTTRRDSELDQEILEYLEDFEAKNVRPY